MDIPPPTTPAEPPVLDTLLQRADIWRGRDTGDTAAEPVLDSGFAALDQALHRGGWPATGLTELLAPAPGPALLRLLLPALSRLHRDDPGLILLANPPARPAAVAMKQAGIDIDRLLVLHSDDPQGTLMRACREAAASDAVAALICWWPDTLRDPRLLRRLHRAGQQGRCWVVILRDQRHLRDSSPAPLRLHCQPQLHHDAPWQLHLHILKQPGGWAGQQLTLPWHPPALHSALGRAARLLAPHGMQQRLQQHAPQHEPLPATPAIQPPPAEPVIYRLGLPGKVPAIPPLDLGPVPHAVPPPLPDTTPEPEPLPSTTSRPEHA
ncbi:hypothetical protein [Isoalcanivorax indicus]|uniref:hypothetical protein n=1 Tax=Isoalcanivorax indicus TaxID=2202653 RepID=UPI000DBA2B9B|nr:hypothetical protein [Isoalcanivorax indicus]